MITLYKIFESKQVGVLYHWTHVQSLKKILETNTLISFEHLMKNVSYSVINDDSKYISFSRNKNLNLYNKPVKIIFDGNKLSNNYKFESYLCGGDKYFKKEAEERIKIDCIENIKRYIIGIEIKTNSPESHFEYIQSLIPDVKIKIIKW